MLQNDDISLALENNAMLQVQKNKIFKAFERAEQPAKDNIALHDCKQCQELREDFAGLKWQEASDELLERNYDKIPLFTPQAFNYFLPAFLIYALNNFDVCTEVGQFTIYALSPGKHWNQDEGSLSHWTERFKLFSEDQMEVVFDFFDLVKENPVYKYELNSVGKKIFVRLKAIKAAG